MNQNKLERWWLIPLGIFISALLFLAGAAHEAAQQTINKYMAPLTQGS